jgi:urea transport system ATP-binding protein
MNDVLLKVNSLRVCYGESEVIGALSLAAVKNEVLAVLGLNGMGKTTLMKALMGLLPARAGSIRLGDADITRAAPFQRVGLGLAYVPQGRMVFPTLSVEENIEAGMPRRERRIPEELYRFFPVLREMRRRRAGNLSGGQQQQLAIARALASHPRVLLLDEPTEGIQPSIIKELAIQLKRIRDEKGLTIVVSEQVLSFALAVADRVIVLSRGAVAYEGTRRELDEPSLGRLLAI